MPRHPSAPLGCLTALTLYALLRVSRAAIGARDECLQNGQTFFELFARDICLPWERQQPVLKSRNGNKSWHPWSFEPFCAQDSNGDEKYCVYSTTEFNNEAGISFIIRPEAAPDFATFVQNASLTERGKRFLSPWVRDTNIAYEVKDLSEKGLGVIASRDIHRGEIIIVGFPALIVDSELEAGPDPDISERDRLQLYATAFGQLSDSKRALSLAASTGGNLHEDIMKTNGFGIRLGGRTYSGLVPETARLNHACVPNANIRFSATSLTVEAVALRDVTETEELSISYIPAELPSGLRSELLHVAYNFSCSCALCSASKEKIMASDQRRDRIVAVRRLLKGQKASKDEIVSLSKEFFRLVELEKLDFKLKEYYNDMAEAFFGLGDHELAYQYTAKALEKADELGSEEDEFKTAIRNNLITLKRILDRKKDQS